MALDSSAFASLQRAAKLSSAAYTGCIGSAFDVTITKQIYDIATDTQIMKGISSPWSAVHDTVISEVQSLIAKYPDYTLESTGHSLGGSLTYLSYVALAQNFPGKKITSNALAAFPIGNTAWANFASSQQGTLNRGNNALDGVPLRALWNQRDLSCSAGNGLVGVTAGHFQSFGVSLGYAGCS
ncbi:hypothetical protein N7462_002299 [Penicillium macrosclerotiorum]|uniref:uncharacterized protein n=1 Tax=Penicillium macrosclerotiorum TaxID=303699 RepID=UPI002547221D|nr:uncharacterized protein N7462_002299 [Penicillium macrosclerotiorum]KAJ5692876.1 hypothetical protein N7462_002299 [Penicillium macrosclerotiorum]